MRIRRGGDGMLSTSASSASAQRKSSDMLACLAASADAADAENEAPC
jgi:hypothetical protein